MHYHGLIFLYLYVGLVCFAFVMVTVTVYIILGECSVLWGKHERVHLHNSCDSGTVGSHVSHILPWHCKAGIIYHPYLLSLLQAVMLKSLALTSLLLFTQFIVWHGDHMLCT